MVKEQERAREREELPENGPETPVAGSPGEGAETAAGTGGAPERGPEGPGAEELTALLAETRAKAEDNWNQLLRVRAEMDNLRKRHERELENAHKFALDSFVRDLLQVRDSLELGQSAAEGGNVDAEKLHEGTALTLRLLGDVMAKFGVEPVDPLDQPFNPEQHQAMSVQPRADVPPNTVITVVQKGYLLNGRLVRPALVIVSTAAGPQA
jgi:molecular chaperone GrpE